MTRRRRNPPKTRRVDGSLILVQVAPTRAATPADREISLAKRQIERALIARGLGKRQALIIVSGMTHDALLAEAARVRAASDPVQAPETPARPWWQRMLGGKS